MEVVYFELNNWFAGQDYPDEEPFLSWMRNDLNQFFRDDDKMKKQKLCVKYDMLDMSQNFCITAPRSWVEENCPKLLTEFKKFVVVPEDVEDIPESKHGYRFLEYCEENFGVTYAKYPEAYWDDEDDEDDDDCEYD
jgi:hypothetical protein